MSQPNVNALREWFPALTTEFAFLENAGGSQLPSTVIDAAASYMSNTYVQLGATYPQSVAATQVVNEAHAYANTIFGGDNIGSTILGPSSTQLVTMLADCFSYVLKPGDRIVVAENGHEANIGPWVKLERFGIEVVIWKVNPETQSLDIADLAWLLKAPTKVLAFTHVSNLLGEVHPVEEICKIARQNGVRSVVDGVAYAPHRLLDVATWKCDFYFYSTYKVYGPHMAALFARTEALDELTGPNHFFMPKTQVPYKFELGGACHEGCAAILGLKPYLGFVSGLEEGAAERAVVSSAFARMEAMELPLQKALIEYLASKKSVKLIGPAVGDLRRIPTISFTHETKKPEEIVAHTDKNQIAIRWGHMYAFRLCEALGIPTTDGVTRISMVHYNTYQEVERLIKVLDEVL